MTNRITLNPKDHPVGTVFIEGGPVGLHTERTVTAWSLQLTSVKLDGYHATVWSSPESIKVVEILKA